MSAGQKRYEELMALMASDDLYNHKDAFDKAMQEYSKLKPKLAQLEEEWLELSTLVEEAMAEAMAAIDG